MLVRAYSEKLDLTSHFVRCTTVEKTKACNFIPLGYENQFFVRKKIVKNFALLIGI